MTLRTTIDLESKTSMSSRTAANLAAASLSLSEPSQPTHTVECRFPMSPARSNVSGQHAIYRMEWTTKAVRAAGPSGLLRLNALIYYSHLIVVISTRSLVNRPL